MTQTDGEERQRPNTKWDRIHVLGNATEVDGRVGYRQQRRTDQRHTPCLHCLQQHPRAPNRQNTAQRRSKGQPQHALVAGQRHGRDGGHKAGQRNVRPTDTDVPPDETGQDLLRLQAMRCHVAVQVLRQIGQAVQPQRGCQEQQQARQQVTAPLACHMVRRAAQISPWNLRGDQQHHRGQPQPAHQSVFTVQQVERQAAGIQQQGRQQQRTRQIRRMIDEPAGRGCLNSLARNFPNRRRCRREDDRAGQQDDGCQHSRILQRSRDGCQKRTAQRRLVEEILGNVGQRDPGCHAQQTHFAE